LQAPLTDASGIPPCPVDDDDIEVVPPAPDAEVVALPPAPEPDELEDTVELLTESPHAAAATSDPAVPRASRKKDRRMKLGQA
jgi:hypothetical protein